MELRIALRLGKASARVSDRDSLVTSATLTEIEPQVAAMTGPYGTISFHESRDTSGRHLSVFPPPT